MGKQNIRLTILFFVTILFVNSRAFALSLRVTHIDSTSFPEIEVLIRLYDDTDFELKPDDLKIYENGLKVATHTIAPVKFKHFISLVIDRSSSIENAMLEVKRAAVGFIRNLKNEASFAIISFGSDIDFNHDFSQNLASLVNAIKKIRPWGGTLLYDAIYDACEDLQARAGLNDLKTILCITDGKDSTPSGQDQLSMHNDDEVIKYAADKSIRIITIGLGEDIDPGFLRRIADETEGWYLHSASADELARLCRIMSDRLKRRHHFRLRFETLHTQLTSDARKLEIQVALNKKTATAARSYHAPNSLEPGEKKEDFAADEKITLSQLFKFLDVPEQETTFFTENIRVPHPKPVYGLTAASFRQASKVECRQLINQARDQIAAKHRENLDRQNAFLKQYLQVIDKRLKQCYKDIDRKGISLTKRSRTDQLCSFLILRRKLIETLMQQAYEIYMVYLKASLEELNYFDRTEVLGQETDGKFLDKNATAKAEGIAAVKEKFSKQLENLNQQLRELFLPEKAQKPLKITNPSAHPSPKNVIETID